LTIAETIWDLAQEPFTGSQVNHGLSQQQIRERIVTPQERKDLRRMQGKDLKMWIRSKGIAVAGQDPKKVEVVKQAEEIWDLTDKSLHKAASTQRGHSKCWSLAVCLEREKISTQCD
jgi:hypothetical protein